VCTSSLDHITRNNLSTHCSVLTASFKADLTDCRALHYLLRLYEPLNVILFYGWAEINCLSATLESRSVFYLWPLLCFQLFALEYIVSVKSIRLMIRFPAESLLSETSAHHHYVFWFTFAYPYC